MDYYGLIERYYSGLPVAWKFLLDHGNMVAEKALRVAARVGHLNPDIAFIKEAAVLHDIGIFMTNAPLFGCSGESPYICHGVFGRELLDREGFPRHGLVCERHVGTGLTREDIRRKGFPLPMREMIPETIEEKIICYADKFFSKAGNPLEEKSVEEVREDIRRYGPEKVMLFDGWANLFGG